MPEAPLHAQEDLRLEALQNLKILDTPEEERFDRYVRIGSEISGCPTALVSLVDEKRQWFKAKLGIEACETGRDSSFCAYAVHRDEPLVIEDATQDPRVADQPLVVGPPYIRAYAGIPIHDSQGWPLGSFCVIDFQPRKFSEKTISLLKDIAQCVENELSNYELNALSRQLAEQTAKAKAANEAKGDFLAFISHEIRTPLNGVLSIADLLLKSSLTQRQLKQAQIIRSSGDLMLNLINDLLDFSKIEAGGLELDLQPTKVRVWAEETTDPFFLWAQEKGLHLERDISEDLPECIDVDAMRLKQIASNLLSNALKFTEEGSVTFRLHPLGKDEFQMTVEDTGMGISPEKQARLFQPFEQGDIHVSRKFGGTGLGLVICKQLAELMGGHISLESSEGKGSRFQVSFRAQTLSPREIQEAAPERQPAPRIEGEERILVVEDNQINREVLNYLLGGETGVRVFQAGTIEEAMHQLQSKAPIHKILLDLNLGSEDGLNLIEKIRERSDELHLGDLQIFAHTADLTERTRKRCLEQGVYGFIPKPIDPVQMRKTLFPNLS